MWDWGKGGGEVTGIYTFTHTCSHQHTLGPVTVRSRSFDSTLCVFWEQEVAEPGLSVHTSVTCRDKKEAVGNKICACVRGNA